MNEGIKEEENKLVYELDWEFVRGMAERMALNKGKYAIGNWKQKIDSGKLNQALIRHFMELQEGNLSDEQLYGHYYALAVNSMMIIYQLKNYSQ